LDDKFASALLFIGHQAINKSYGQKDQKGVEYISDRKGQPSEQESQRSCDDRIEPIRIEPINQFGIIRKNTDHTNLKKKEN